MQLSATGEDPLRHGFPSQGRKGKITGECIFPEASADEHYEIIIRFDRDDPAEVLDVLVHQLVHAVTTKNHDQKFRDAALTLGLNVKDGLRRPDQRGLELPNFPITLT